MNLGEMKTAIKRYGFSDDDPLATWVNWGMYDLQREHDWWFLNDYGTVALIAGEKYSNVLPPMKHIISMRIVGEQLPLAPMTIQEYLRDVSDPDREGMPTHFILLADRALVWYPVSSTVETVEFFYKQIEEELVADGSTPLFIPKDLHQAIVLKAVAYGLQAESEEGRATDALTQYNQVVSRSIADRVHSTSGPQYVQDVSEY